MIPILLLVLASAGILSFLELCLPPTKVKLVELQRHPGNTQARRNWIARKNLIRKQQPFGGYEHGQ